MADKLVPSSPADASEPLFSFGVIADIQYADLEDGYNYQRSRRRYYRHSLIHLQGAIEDWNKESSMPCCVLQLGDIIDGWGKGLSEPQYVQFNGGFSQEQLNWLNEVLTFSDTNQEKVVIVSHLPIYPEASDSVCLAWNYVDALSIIWSHKCVVCFLAGHTHDGGYSEDPFGVHHVNLEGVIETAPDSQAFGTVHVFPDKMLLKGRGRVPDRIMNYKREQAL